MEDVLFVVNPRAASGRAARVWSKLCDRMRSLRTANVVLANEPVAAAKSIVAALNPRIRRVVTVGGDGALHYTLNILMTDAPDQERCVGLIPVGTGSDLARGLGLEMKPERALERALESASSRLDALRLHASGQTRYFINEASLGITTRVAARVNTLARRNTATFLTAALHELASYRPQWARIHLDGKPWREGLFYMLVVANGSHFAKGMRIAPMANPADGFADIVVVEAVPKAVVLAWLPTIYFGKHVAAPFVHCAQATSVEIETSTESATFEGDGEVAMAAPGSIELVRGAVLFTGAARQQ